MYDDYSVVKAVERCVRRISVSYEGHDISYDDEMLFREVVVYHYCLLTDLLPENGEARRRYRGFLGIPCIDIRRFAQTLKYVDSEVKNYFEAYDKGVRGTLLGFKHQVKAAGLYWGLLEPVAETLDAFFKCPSSSLFAVLNSYLNFPGRVNFRSLDMKEEMERDYVAFENGIKEWEYDQELIQEMNSVMREWLSDFTFENFVPKHGPGSISGFTGRFTPVVKHQLVNPDLRLRYFLNHDGIDTDYFPVDMARVPETSRVSELVCVPKSMLTNRTISKEPCTLQYTQQGVFRALDEYFQSTPLRHHIDLHDQERSQRLAQHGSRDGSFATIDLSSASDSVTLTLVKGVFAGTPLYRAMICTRSDATRLPSGEVLPLLKFAPMGSALCFPTECLVFACACEVAARRRRWRRPKYLVYGDDIVVPSSLAEDVIDILTALHFKVNEGKSYWNVGTHCFREACGGEYVDGIDVAPIRVSRWFAGRTYGKGANPCGDISHANMLAAYIDFANKAFDRGCLHLRSAIMRNIKSSFRDYRKIPFTTDGSQGFKTYEDCCTNYHLKKRCDSNGPRRRPSYGYTEYYALCFLSKTLRGNELKSQYKNLGFDPLDREDETRWFEYWRSGIDGAHYHSSEFAEWCDDIIDVRPSVSAMTQKWVYLSK